MIKKTAEMYGVKIDLARAEKFVRVTSDFEACGDIFRLIEYMVGSIRKETLTLSLTGSDAKESEKFIKTAQMRETEKLTSTIIREVKESKTVRKALNVKVCNETLNWLTF